MDELINKPDCTFKSAQLSGLEITDADMALINTYALSPLTPEDVFVFRAVLCDNRVDRDHERFSVQALTDLKLLFPGKPVINDHSWSAKNQVARIFSTEIETTSEQLDTGEPYVRLIAKIYMVRTAANKNLIAEINGGIRKEVSVGVRVGDVKCSICGGRAGSCSHYAGRKYEVDGELQKCHYVLANCTDAYELSMVPIPAQPAAAICKRHVPQTEIDPKSIHARLRIARAKINALEVER